MKSYKDYVRALYADPDHRNYVFSKFGNNSIDYWVTFNVFEDAGIQEPWKPGAVEKLDAYLAGYDVFERLKIEECIVRTFKNIFKQ